MTGIAAVQGFFDYTIAILVCKMLLCFYETIISPTVTPYAEYEKYREDMPYYRNTVQKGVTIVA